MKLIDKIRAILSQINKDYTLILETERMMNVRADDRPYPIAFWEEYTNGTIQIDTYGRKVESRVVEIAFMRLAPRDNYQCDAVERERIREQIKDEVVYAFIDAVNASEDFAEVGSWEIIAQPPIFDAVEVAVLVRFTLTYFVC